MIASIKTESLGFTYTRVNVPETYEEFDGLKKKANAALESALDNETYRGSNGEFRRTLVTKVEEKTGNARKTEPARAAKPDEKPEDVPVRYTETEAVYINRVIADGDITKDDIQSLIDNDVDFNISAVKPDAERKAPEAKASKSYIAAATKAYTDGNGAKLAGLLSSRLGTNVIFSGELGNKDSDIKALAVALVADKKRMEAEQASELGL